MGMSQRIMCAVPSMPRRGISHWIRMDKGCSLMRYKIDEARTSSLGRPTQHKQRQTAISPMKPLLGVMVSRSGSVAMCEPWNAGHPALFDSLSGCLPPLYPRCPIRTRLGRRTILTLWPGEPEASRTCLFFFLTVSEPMLASTITGSPKAETSRVVEYGSRSEIIHTTPAITWL